MKYSFLFLLFYTVCHAQIYNKVTAYRIVVQYDDGPCSIVRYVKSGEFGSVYTAESSDIMMIQNLLALKKQARKWVKTGFWCTPKTIGGDLIDNMFVFKGEKTNDTLFTTTYKHLVVLPDKQVAYVDKDLAVYKALNNHFKAFFDKDFREDFNQLSNNLVLDSISSDNLMYKGKAVTQLNFPEIKNQTQSSKEIDVLESVENSITDYFYTYEADRDIIETKNNKSIESVIINNPDTFSIGDIKVGDNEELVAITYPRSARHTYPDSKKFEEMEYKYNYEIVFENNKGDAIISIDKKRVRSIKITLR